MSYGDAPKTPPDALPPDSPPPSTPPGAHDFMRHILADLDHRMRRFGTSAMMAYLLLPNSQIVPMMLEDEPVDVAKDGFANMVDLMATASAATCLAIAIEAWSLPKEVLVAEGAEGAERNRKTGISKHPKRIEVLSVMCEWPDAVVCLQAEIKRKGEAYAGHGEPTDYTVHPHQMRSRFSGIIRSVSAEERIAARQILRMVMPAVAEDFLKIADLPAPTTN